MHVCDIIQLANSNQMQAYIESLVRFNQDQVTDVPKPVPVHLWLEDTITNSNLLGCCVMQVVGCIVHVAECRGTQYSQTQVVKISYNYHIVTLPLCINSSYISTLTVCSLPQLTCNCPNPPNWAYVNWSLGSVQHHYLLQRCYRANFYN